MNYGELIKSAFWISLQNRYLWFFGFFASSSIPNLSGSIPNGGGGLDSAPSGSGFSSALQGGNPLDNVALIVGIIFVALLLTLVFVFFTLVSQGGLAGSVAALDRGEGRRFGSTFRAGISSFWRVLGYYVVLFLIGVVFVLIIGVPLALLVAGVFAGTDSTGARIGLVVLVALLGILLFVAVFVPLSIIGQFALRGIAIDREGVLGSIGSGYRLFRRNLGRSLLVWLISIGLAIGLGIALLVAGAIVGLILFLPAIALGLGGYPTAAVVAGAIAGLILLPLFLVASGAIGTFKHAYWTLAYLRLASRNAVPVANPAV